MRKVKKLTESEIVTLEQAVKYAKKAHFRRRCEAILLSNRGKKVSYIADLFQIFPQRVHIWFNWWEEKGIAGLFISAGRGKKKALSPEKIAEIAPQIQAAIAENPQSLRQVADELAHKISLPITPYLLKNFLKKK
jgi:transposase